MWQRNKVGIEGTDKQVTPNKNLEIVGQEKGAPRNSKCKDPEVTGSKLCLHGTQNFCREEPEVKWEKSRHKTTINLICALSRRQQGTIEEST